MVACPYTRTLQSIAVVPKGILLYILAQLLDPSFNMYRCTVMAAWNGMRCHDITIHTYNTLLICTFCAIDG